MGSLHKDSNSLLTEDHRGVLDTIDSLRSKGIGKYVDLPQIIVCGDQSSGKSSVLEAISGLSFPTKDALCTRFATELVLRRSSETTAKFSILPGSDRTDSEKKKLSSFRHTTSDLDLAKVIGDAQELMGLNGKDRVFSTDILRVELSSPTQPHLTLVDLPGLFLAGNKTQSLEDAKMVEHLVLSYMEQPRSIILAVVSAKSEFALQQVTQRAREKDPDGHRTVGLITKPDTLDEGSESQTSYLELAHNRDVEFRHGWHVVRNRDFKSRNSSRAERDAAEEAFFSSGVWSSLSPAQLGIQSLITKLSKLLYDHTLSNLPEVLQEVDSGISSCRQSLQKLGHGRESTRDQIMYLVRLSQSFNALVDASARGDYYDPSFFKDSKSEVGYQRRLRARVQNCLIDFSKAMFAKGKAVTIVDDPEKVSETSEPRRVLRQDYIYEVSIVMARNRGRELPGSFNPLMIQELFAAQCQPWKSLAQDCIDAVLEAAQDILQSAIEHVADEVTAERLLLDVIKSSFQDIRLVVQEKLDELLYPHLEGHPITYNIYLINKIQEVKQDRHKEGLLKSFRDCVNLDEKDREGAAYTFTDMERVFTNVQAFTMPDLEYGASETAVDFMEEYYNVAYQKFTDDVGVLAIEQCVIRRLASVLSADSVLEMEEKKVNDLASESPETLVLRKRLTEKLEVLEAGKKALGGLRHVRF
ncbi:Dynamin central region [Geosmithia morbida]|uniref:Dynamin central region n=1 Tax=Geosmithia morbida TaxID=1094350 RepID=A0A9P4YQV4_9HYPO|nr:Dynamin central region [Geosmithia morbida]KAF4121448.1 Dynamin central region [Geosmithia morbida]